MAPTFQLGNWGFVTCGGHLAVRKGGLRAGRVRADPGREGWGGQGLEGRGGGGEGEQGTPASRLKLGGSLGGSQGGRGPAAQSWGPHEERQSGPRPKSQGPPPRQARASCQDQLPPKPLPGRLSSRGSHSDSGPGPDDPGGGCPVSASWASAVSPPPPGPWSLHCHDGRAVPATHRPRRAHVLSAWPGRLCMTGPAVPARCLFHEI